MNPVRTRRIKTGRIPTSLLDSFQKETKFRSADLGKLQQAEIIRVAEMGPAKIGFSSGWAENGVLKVPAIFVEPNSQRKGGGTALFKSMLSEARKRKLQGMDIVKMRMPSVYLFNNFAETARSRNRRGRYNFAIAADPTGGFNGSVRFKE